MKTSESIMKIMADGVERTTNQIAELLNVQPSQISAELTRLAKAGKLSVRHVKKENWRVGRKLIKSWQLVKHERV